MYDERNFYTPQYFQKLTHKNEKTGKTEFHYEVIRDKYWRLRDAGDWSKAPRIFEDDQQAFF